MVDIGGRCAAMHADVAVAGEDLLPDCPPTSSAPTRQSARRTAAARLDQPPAAASWLARCPTRWRSGSRSRPGSVTDDVRALAWVAVAAGDVAAAVVDAAHRLDAEVVVADRAVSAQLRAAVIDVEAVAL